MGLSSLWSSCRASFRPGGKNFRLAAISGTVALTDQISKLLIARLLAMYETIQVIPGFFNITHLRNPGGAFGIFADGSPLLRRFLFLFVSGVAAAIVLVFHRNTPETHPWLLAAFALIFGGAIGNLIDRLRLGRVIDFLDFHLGGWHWPAFNVADSAITVGVCVFALHVLFNKLPE